MGLDMYLSASTYVSGWEHGTEEEREKYRTLLDLTDMADAASPDSPSLTVDVTVAYWRKANQIHKWFVDNVQDGKDECVPHYVSRGQLVTLLDLCRRVLATCNLVPGKIHAGTTYAEGKTEEHWEDGKVIEDPSVAQELLPSESGFFFGSTTYDEWYVHDLQNTVEQIDRALTTTPEHVDFEYRSSW